MTVTQPPPPPPVNTTALRLGRTSGDMTKAVLVLLVPVMLFVGLYVFFFGGSNVIAIDPSGSYADARAAAAFTVLQPSGLPSGWKPITAAYENGQPATLRVGYVAPDKGGIQLIESDQDPDAFISTELGHVASVATTVPAGGRTWGQLTSTSSGDKALVDTEAGRTVIILGDADWSDLTRFASSLR